MVSVQCGKWIHGRCAGVKRASIKFSINSACVEYEENIGEAVEQKKKLCDEVEKAWEFTYLGDIVRAGGGCEAAVTARTRCGCVKFTECGELQCGRRSPIKLKWAAHRSYARQAILYGNEAWCLKESEMGILRRTERFMVRAMCGVQLRQRDPW